MSIKGMFQNTSIHELSQVLDLAALRQKAYASNIANANVPGYRRLEVPFAEQLQQSTQRLRMQATQPGHRTSAPVGAPGGPGAPEMVAQQGEKAQVDLDQEMVSLAENQLRFNLGARLAALQIAGLRASIHGRR